MDLQEANSEELQDYLFLSKIQMKQYFDEFSLEWSDKKREGYLSESQVFCILNPDFSGYLQLCEKENELFIYDLQIIPELQGQGIGTKVLHTVIDLARSKSLESIRLGSFSSNPALRLYERIGFQIARQNSYFTWYRLSVT